LRGNQFARSGLLVQPKSDINACAQDAADAFHATREVPFGCFVERVESDSLGYRCPQLFLVGTARGANTPLVDESS
jgi:hypothetical protein